MALLYCNGFECYASLGDAGMTPMANNLTGIGGTYGRYGTGGLFSNDYGRGAYLPIGSPESSGGAAFAYYHSVAPTSSRVILALNDLSVPQIAVGLSPTGEVLAMRDQSTVVVGYSGSYVLPGWNHYEIKATIGASSSGSVQIWVNGASVLSLASVTTQTSANSYFYCIQFGNDGSGGGPGTLYWDDVVVYSGTGGVTGPIGDCRVQAIRPSGAGATTQMTPSAGSNYTCVDDTTPNGDTDYVSETTAGEKDTYAFGNLTSTSGTIKGIQILISARKDDAGSRSIAPVYRPASTDYDGTTVSVGDSYAYRREITEVSPETSVAWTIAEINGAEFGVTLKA